MPAPSLSWNLCRVYGTWRNLNGTMKSGSYTVTIPARVTDATDDTIIPAGTLETGTLQTQNDAIPSLDIMVPCTDDPDIQQTGWQVQIVVTFDDKSAKESYSIDVPYADRPTSDGGNGDGVDLRTVVLPANLPTTQAQYKVGVAGGLAQLNSSGDVINADGSTPSGGGGGGGSITADGITDATAVGKELIRVASQDSLMGLLEAASPTVAGLVALASNTDATTGTDTAKAVTSAALHAAITAAISALVNSAPGTLDTLGEIATQLAADESGAAALATTVGGKLAKASNLSDVASAVTALANLGGVPSSRTVAGHPLTANVTLAPADVSLPNVDNTHDSAKSVAAAAKVSAIAGTGDFVALRNAGNTLTTLGIDLAGHLVINGTIQRFPFVWKVGDPDPTVGGTLTLPPGVYPIFVLDDESSKPSWASGMDSIDLIDATSGGPVVVGQFYGNGIADNTALAATSGGNSGDTTVTSASGAGSATVQTDDGTVTPCIEFVCTAQSRFLVFDDNTAVPTSATRELALLLKTPASFVTTSFAQLALANALQVRFSMTSSGQLRVVDSTSTAVYTSTATLAANTWYHIEISVTQGAGSTGAVRIRAYAHPHTGGQSDTTVIDSNTPTPLTGLNIGTSHDQVDVGAASSVTTDFKVGKVRWNDDPSYIGDPS